MKFEETGLPDTPFYRQAHAISFDYFSTSITEESLNIFGSKDAYYRHTTLEPASLLRTIPNIINDHDIAAYMICKAVQADPLLARQVDEETAKSLQAVIGFDKKYAQLTNLDWDNFISDEEFTRAVIDRDEQAISRLASRFGHAAGIDRTPLRETAFLQAAAYAACNMCSSIANKIRRVPADNEMMREYLPALIFPIKMIVSATLTNSHKTGLETAVKNSLAALTDKYLPAFDAQPVRLVSGPA